MKKRRGFWKNIEHHTNSLHLYCKLCKLTENRGRALKVSGLWEKTVFYRAFRKIVGKERK